jgi:hypothetical protein
MIERGELHLTGASRVAPQLTPEDADEILDAVMHKTKREIEEILVRWSPLEDLPDSMMPVDADHPSNISPLSPGRFSLCFTATARCCDLIGEAKALSSHRSPRGLGEIIEAALEAYVEMLEKQRFKTTDRPQPQRESSSDPRHIPAQVMREVYARDGGCCTYVGPNGRRCRARSFLQFDHITPIELGGQSTADNLRLRCFTHNQLAAREALGEELMERRNAGRADRADRSEQLVPERVSPRADPKPIIHERDLVSRRRVDYDSRQLVPERVELRVPDPGTPDPWCGAPGTL